MREFLHHLFVPRESNNHRAHVLHAQPLFLLVALLALMQFLTPQITRTYPEVLGLEANISVDDLVSLTNQKRAESGLSPLSLDSQLSQAAALKAQDMFAKNYWAHNAPDGTTPWVFVKTAGYEYVYAGENLARGFTTAPDAVNAWMASPGHRENMLSGNYKEVGFAVAAGSLTGDDTILIVEMFGSRMSGSSAVGSAQQLAFTPSPTSVLLSITPVLPTATPFPVFVAEAFATPKPTIEPTPIVSTAPKSADQLSSTTLTRPVINKPLVDTASWARTFAIVLTSLFMIVFVLDMIVVERKEVARLVSHNIDHVMFLTIILLTLILYGSGVIL